MKQFEVVNRNSPPRAANGYQDALESFMDIDVFAPTSVLLLPVYHTLENTGSTVGHVTVEGRDKCRQQDTPRDGGHLRPLKTYDVGLLRVEANNFVGHDDWLSMLQRRRWSWRSASCVAGRSNCYKTVDY